MSDTTAKHAVKSGMNLTLRGIAGSPGIGIGKAYLVAQEDVDVVEKRFVEPENIPAEVRRFKEGVKRA
jgi:phosphoenolpyruvate-protein kinase (PTS system EI component)